jgi:hypothetical protein
MADPSDKGRVAFTRDAARRISDATVWVERANRGEPPRRTRRYPVGSDDGFLAKTPSGGIPALSGTTPGSASCTLGWFDGSAIQTTTDTLTIYNIGTTAVAGNKWCLINWFDSTPFVVVEPC